MSLFNKYLKANSRSIREAVSDEAGRGVVLIDSMQIEIFYVHGILKTGMIFADIEGLAPVAYPSERAPWKVRQVVKSLCRRVVPVRRRFLFTAVCRLPTVLKRVLLLGNRREILAIEIDGCEIGPYLYDATYVPTIERVTLWQRIRVAYLLTCHYVDRAVLDAYPVRLALVGDPAGRTGMLFCPCRARGIRTINAINIDVLQMQKYFSPHGPGPALSATCLKRRWPCSKGTARSPARSTKYLAARFQGQNPAARRRQSVCWPQGGSHQERVMSGLRAQSGTAVGFRDGARSDRCTARLCSHSLSGL